jgi:hypothetical protein
MMDRGKLATIKHIERKRKHRSATKKNIAR